MRLAPLMLLLAVGCGGHAYFDPYAYADPGAGGAGGHGVTSSTSTTATGGSGGEGGAPPATTGSSLDELDLGTVPIDTPAGFDVPSNAIGFTAIVYSPQPFGGVGVRRLRAPNDELVIDDYNIEPTAWTFSWPGTTVAAVPQSDAASAMPHPLPGTWQLTLGNPTGKDAEANVRVWLRRTASGAFEGGKMDVNVFVAALAAPEPYVTEVLHAAFDDYAGLTLGSVTFYELGDEWSDIDKQSFLPLVEQSAAATQAPALNIFVVKALTGDFESAAGVSAGIPGQGVDHGTHSSGVVWTPTGSPAIDALILRHESGHLAGLFHTSEIMKGAFDPLADTVTCDDVEGKLYSCPDAKNVMFPVAGQLALEISAMQGRVIQGSTLYSGQLKPAPDQAEAQPPQGAGSPAASSLAAAPLQLLGPQARMLLTSHWCVRSGLEPWRLLSRLASRADWRRLRDDPRAPGWIRARAARAARRR